MRSAALLAGLALSASCSAQSSASITIVSQEHDARIALVHEAVDFWNRTFAELGTPFRLGPVNSRIGAIPAEELAAISRAVLDRRGRAPGAPQSVLQVPGDIVVALSDGEFISFATRWVGEQKRLVAIKSERSPPLTLPNVARNVIAHELGHALGLGHNDDPAMLMCGRPAACRPGAFESRVPRFFPLTSDEQAQLRRMYRAD